MMTPRVALGETRFALLEGLKLLQRRTPLRPPPPNYGADLELPPEGSVLQIDGISLRVDPRMSEFNTRKVMVGRHTEHERALLSRHLRDDDRVLELGGGIGMVAIHCARRLGPGRVTSYEGNPELESLIRDNYALNGVEPDLHMCIVGDRRGTATFHLHARFSHSRLGDAEGAVRSVEVPVVPFVEVAASCRPSVLVADIQGAEVDFFSHADLTELRMVLVELHPPLIGLRGMLQVREALRSAGLVEADRAGTSFVYLRPGA